MSDIGDTWNDRHKWNNRQDLSRSVHVLFVYRVAKMSSQVHVQIGCFENISKFQQILAKLLKLQFCDEVYFQKRIISKTGECALKKNSATIVFLYCDINQFKTLKISSPFIDQERFLIFSFSIHWSGEIFPFPLTFPNEGWICAA